MGLGQMWTIVSRDYSHYLSKSGDEMDNTRIEADLAVMLDFITGGRIAKNTRPKDRLRTSGHQGFTGSDLFVEGEVSLDGKTTIRLSGEPLPTSIVVK
jgi:hypothetical protein